MLQWNFDTLNLSGSSLLDMDSYAGGVGSPYPVVADYAPPLLFSEDVAGDITSSALIAVGGSVDVTIDTVGDHDWYRVTLVAGTAYTIQTASNGSGTDAFLNLRNAAGMIIASNDDGGDGFNSLISFTATASGTYFIDAGTYNNLTAGSFRLFVAPINIPPGDSVGDTVGTAATLAIGGTVNGRIEYHYDHDFYAVNLVAGQTYLFRTAGTSATTTTDTILKLRDASGAQLQTNNDAGEAGFSAIRFTTASTGTYYLDVSGYDSSIGLFNLTAFTAPTPLVYTNDQIATQLTHGYWAGQSRHWDVAAGGTITVNITGLTLAGQSLASLALDLWTDATGIIFSAVSTGGQLTFDDNQAGAFASSIVSGGIITSAQVNVGQDWLAAYGADLNSYSFMTYIHEIGHALGLGHAGNYNGSGDYVVDSLYLNDSWGTTVMSYFDQFENTYFQEQGFTRQFVATPLVSDLIAATNLYGTASTTRTGDTIYGVGNTSGRPSYEAYNTPLTVTIVDHAGVDTLNYSGYRHNQRIDLNSETFSNVGGQIGNLTIARGTVVENTIGGLRHDILIGNSVANRLEGSNGDDELTGGGGSDILIGDGGADVAIFAGNVEEYSITTVGAVTTVTGLGARAGDGADTLTGIESIRFANATVALGGDPNNPVEVGPNAIASFTTEDGTAFDIGLPYEAFFDLDAGTVLIYAATLADGSPLPSWLTFDVATQIFNGTAPVSAINAVFKIRVIASDQSSSVSSNFSLTITEALGAGIEGTSGPDQLYGTFRSEYMGGLDGDDRLHGSAGSDQLYGGGGTGDIVDYGTSNAAVTLNLGTGAASGGDAEGDILLDIEGASGTNFADNITGTEFGNQLFGMGGDDILEGIGGIDSLYGGDGNDRLSVRLDNGSTVDGGAGVDTLFVDGQDITFASIASIEAIELASSSMILTGSQFATGLAKNSAISGNGIITVNMEVGVNFVASGMAFAEADVAMVVNGTSGIDIIKLGLGNSTGNTVNGGDGVDQIRGSQGIDTINGDGGNDKIMGLGGADVLTGGAGNDQFRYFAATDSGYGTDTDQITDFTIGGDRFNFALIDADVATAGDQAFSFIGTGVFAATGIGQIRYETSGTDLLVQTDVDGDGIADMEIILQGLNGGTLTAGDFIL